MFGYITPDKQELRLKDFYLYKAYYCGLCITTGKRFGSFARFTTNYDMTFLSSLLHSYLKQTPEILQTHCVLHPIRKRSVVKSDAILNILSAVNVLLMYVNTEDDVQDEASAKAKTAHRLLKKAYRRAAKEYPEIDRIIRTQYDRLRRYEKEGETCLDALCDPFAQMIADCGQYIVQQVDNTLAPDPALHSLFYNLGKWVYLIDAADDYDRDCGKNFNPLASAFPECKSAQELIQQKQSECAYIFYAVLNNIIQQYEKTGIQSQICDNIIYIGIRHTTKEFLEEGKCTKIRI